jgi:phage minor structural protein
LIFILDSDEKVVGILTNNGSPKSCPYYDDVLKESIEVGASTYEFYVPSNNDVVDTIQEGGYIVRADLDGNLRMFSIMQVEETHGSENKKYVYAEDAGLELLNDIVRPGNYESKNQDQILDIVLLGSRWKRGETEYLGVANFTFENYDNVLATLQSIAKQLGGEFSFRVEMKNGEVIGRYVDFVKQRGTDTKKRFTYSKDIVSITRKVDMSNVVTALVGVGSNDTTFKDIEYTKSANGFDKPLNQDWVGDPDALQRWGKQGKHIFGKFEYETTDPRVLLDKTWQQLQKQKNPAITYELDVALLERLAGIEHEKVRIGDTVYVIDETFSPPLYLEARVLELETSFSDPTKDKCTLGNYKIVKSNITAQMRAIQSKLLKKEATWDQVEDALNIATDAQQTVDEVKDDIVYKVEIISTNGIIFKNGMVSTNLIAVVYKGKDDITSTLPNSAFIWQKINSDGTHDTEWENAHQGVGRSVTVTNEEIASKATFQCLIDIQE